MTKHIDVEGLYNIYGELHPNDKTETETVVETPARKKEGVQQDNTLGFILCIPVFLFVAMGIALTPLVFPAVLFLAGGVGNAIAVKQGEQKRAALYIFLLLPVFSGVAVLLIYAASFIFNN